MPDPLSSLAYAAIARLVAPQQWARQPDLLHALATDDQRRLVRALVAAEASTQLLLVPAAPWQADSSSGTLVQQVLTTSLGALLWASTPETQPRPLVAVEAQHLLVSPTHAQVLLHALLVTVLEALHDGALVCSVRLDSSDPQQAVMTLESDRPGLHTRPETRLRLAAALAQFDGHLACHRWAQTWITTLRVPACAVDDAQVAPHGHEDAYGTP
jgi:hypothetical protein